MAAAPDLITAVIGFRQFRVLDSGLWSARADYLWERGPHTAVCLAGLHQGGDVPAKGCTCGFYARYTPPPRTASAMTMDLVAGAVALWGRIELHAHGMRAQQASVVALALPVSRWGKRRRTIAAAEQLGIPAVPARRLVAATVEAGRIIPKEMRPPDVMPNKRQAPGPPAPARLNAVADGLVQRRHPG
jgi:hypothetical protein